MSGAAPAVRDPGLQAERTALAWIRTSLAILVNALLALRSAWATGHLGVSALAVTLLFAAAAAAACGVWRRHMLLGASTSIAPPAIAMLASALTVWLGCATALTAMLAGR